MSTTRPVTLDENGRCHYPSSLRDDKELPSLDYQTPSGIRITFRVLGSCVSWLGADVLGFPGSESSKFFRNASGFRC